MIENPELPLVTAITIIDPTSLPLVDRILESFQRQTYPRKELVIVNNTDTSFATASLSPELPADVKLVDTQQQLSAGMCRNYALSIATGSVLVQFDADSWHSPERLKSQLESMFRHQAHICLLTRTLAYSYISGLATYRSNRKGFIPNTMMMVRSEESYADLRRGEEVELLARLVAAGHKPISLDRPALVCRLYGSGGPVLEPVQYSPEPVASQHFTSLLRAVREGVPV